MYPPTLDAAGLRPALGSASITRWGATHGCWVPTWPPSSAGPVSAGGTQSRGRARSKPVETGAACSVEHSRTHTHGAGEWTGMPTNHGLQSTDRHPADVENTWQGEHAKVRPWLQRGRAATTWIALPPQPGAATGTPAGALRLTEPYCGLCTSPRSSRTCCSMGAVACSDSSLCSATKGASRQSPESEDVANACVCEAPRCVKGLGTSAD